MTVHNPFRRDRRVAIEELLDGKAAKIIKRFAQRTL
jgi:hypothetical protein